MQNMNEGSIVSRRTAIILAVSLLCIGSAVWLLKLSLTRTAERHILAELAASSTHPSLVQLTNPDFSLSATHLIRIRFDITNHPELSSAQWRLRPYAEVVAEK